jgi:hypothetical protein
MIKIKRPYLTFEEVAERFRLSVDSMDLRRIVLSGILRPRLIVRQELPRARVSAGCLEAVLDSHGAPIVDLVEGWVYPHWPMQSAPFEATYAAAARVANPTDADELWLWPEGPTLSSVLTHAVVAEEDLNDAEAVLTAEAEPNLKRQNSVAKLLTIMAYSGYRWDRKAARSDVVQTIVSDGDQLGLEISRGTVLQLLREAWDTAAPVLSADKAHSSQIGDAASPIGAQLEESTVQTD